MTRITHRQQPSGAKTVHSPGKPARRAVATLALALLFSLAASEARAVIAFVKNIGTNSSATTGTTIELNTAGSGFDTTIAVYDAPQFFSPPGGVSPRTKCALSAGGVRADVQVEIAADTNV